MSVAQVRVAATSANLGPGYDCAGLAVGLFDELTAKLTNDGELRITVDGEGVGSVPLDERHLVVRSLIRGLAEANVQLTGLRLRCVNRIPHGRGLGSSSAAIVGGLALARGMLADGRGILSDARLLQIASEIEGHPDNVAPAILGGFTLAWMGAAGAEAIRLQPHADLQPVVAIPARKLATARARELLPESVPHAAAATNAARSALLVHAMTMRPDLLLTATSDLLHQDYRQSAYPQSYALMTALREESIPAMISGAGPTVIAFGVGHSQREATQVVEAIERIQHAVEVEGETFRAECLELADRGLIESKLDTDDLA